MNIPRPFRTASKVLVAAALLAVAAAAFAGSAAAVDNAAAIQSVYRHWAVPRAAELVAASARLTSALQTVCAAPADQAEGALQQARAQWLASVQSWERLSTVAIGPLIERRSQRQIDFTPTRPRMIEKAVKSGPASAADMELIGTPAKGFPALEWLLWVRPLQPASPECRYAVQLATEIEREALALDMAYRQAASKLADASAAASAMSEMVNQWVGGIERLRWPNLEMPVRVAISSNRDSVASATVWAAEWSALRTLASSRTEGLLTLESILRARLGWPGRCPCRGRRPGRRLDAESHRHRPRAGAGRRRQAGRLEAPGRERRGAGAGHQHRLFRCGWGLNHAEPA
jgi:uncharacterized protein